MAKSVVQKMHENVNGIVEKSKNEKQMIKSVSRLVPRLWISAEKMHLANSDGK